MAGKVSFIVAVSLLCGFLAVIPPGYSISCLHKTTYKDYLVIDDETVDCEGDYDKCGILAFTLDTSSNIVVANCTRAAVTVITVTHQLKNALQWDWTYCRRKTDFQSYQKSRIWISILWTVWALGIKCLGIFRVEEHHLSMIICPHHREKYGLRWRCGKVRCGVPYQLAGHKSLTAKGDRGMNSRESSFVFIETGELHPVGTPICKRCREHVKSLIDNTSTLELSSDATSLEASSCLLVPSTSETEYDTDHSESSELESAQSTRSLSPQTSGANRRRHLCCSGRVQFLRSTTGNPYEHSG
ncbi:hypothetical protein ACROYT_G038576 [Oculina patagonica]